MLYYQLNEAQDKHFYDCLPELVVYNTQSKKTILFSLCAARIVHLFSCDLKKHPVAEAEMKQYCCQEENYSVEDFEQSLDHLLRMKMIESVE